MAKDETGISRITDHGDSLRIEGVHEGRKADVMMAKADLEAYRTQHGEHETQAMLRRSLAGGREDRDYRAVRP